MAIEVFKRYIELRDAGLASDGSINLIASSDEPVSFGGYREILSHGRDAVDTSTCTALLLNHDPDQIVGRVDGIAIAGGKSSARAVISADARARSGPKVRDLVKDGTLRGISVSYAYDPETDAVYDEASRTVTVNSWRMLEVSLTPIPRDKTAMVTRSLHAHFAARAANQPNPDKKVESPMALELKRLLELQKAHPDHAIAIAERAAAGDDEAKITAWIDGEKARSAAAAWEAGRAAELATLKREAEITKVAESHGLPAAKYRAMSSMDLAIAEMLKDKAASEASKSRGFSPRGVEGVTVTRDAGDKFIAAATDAMLCRSAVITKRSHVENLINPKQDGSLSVVGHAGEESRSYNELGMRDLGARNLRILDLVRRCAALEGRQDARDWDDHQAADFAMRASNIGWAQQYQKRAANDTFSMFGGILANVMDKALILGFQGFENITFDQWCRMRQVMDFKQFSAAALTLGNLQSTVENVAFPELTAKDSNYVGTLLMWGGTLTLTLQALLSDDLGEFFARLGQAGMIAKRTMDREVYNQLVNFSYNTNDDVTGAALGTQDNLDKVRNQFRKKVNPAGQFIGTFPRFLIHPVGLARAAAQATGAANPPGEQSYLASNPARTLKAIEVNYLDDPTIGAGSSSTKYFLAGDATSDTIVVATLAGMQTPQVMEFDPGATAARKFKIMMPFVAVPATYTDGNGVASRLVGITRGGP